VVLPTGYKQPSYVFDARQGGIRSICPMAEGLVFRDVTRVLCDGAYCTVTTVVSSWNRAWKLLVEGQLLDAMKWCVEGLENNSVFRRNN
jgi:hypothetical protein